ncbi:MAG: carboxypeptidase-like regulatory domain-containing protein, partial [Pseudomonadales bacterium]
YIDLRQREIRYAGIAEPLDFIAGFSDITSSREVFLPPRTIARIFDLELVWEDDLYQFTATTDHRLKIWGKTQVENWGSGAELIEDELPEIFNQATPINNSLDYVQVRVAADITGSEQSDTFASVSTSQDFWGGLAGGRYELRFQQPDLRWQDGEGFDSGDQNLSVPRRMLWAKAGRANEMMLGDASFAVNELVLPFVDFTGLRASGAVGTGTEKSNELSGYGPNSDFANTERYEGVAELGSTVTLFINDSQIATAEVYEEPDSAVGFGRYVFDEVTIPRGNLVAIRIEIVEPNGRIVIRDLSTTSTSRLRPAGQFSYIGGVGTIRERDRWESNGVLSAARMLYGVAPWLTVGATLGYQDGAERQFSSIFSTSRDRADQSEHFGVELVTRPFSNAIVGAAFATSDGERDAAISAPTDLYQGDSYIFDIDYFAGRRLSIYSRAYRYEPGFFNGVDASLEDRQGFYTRIQPKLNKFGFSAYYGSIENNIDDQLADTTRSDYFGLNISSSNLLPRTYLWAEVDKVEPKSFDSKTFISGGFRTEVAGFYLGGQLANGDLFELADDVLRLFQNIALPEIRVSGSPSSSLSISRSFRAHRFALEFDGPEKKFSERGKFTHYWDSPNVPGRFFGEGSLRVVTELGYNDLSDSEFASNRLNLYLDRRRRNRVGLVTDYDSDAGWSWSIDFNLTNVLAFRNNRFINVSSAAVSPGYGGVSGMVFLDKNANGKRDRGERGLQNVAVKSSEGHVTKYTDRFGEFYISRRANQNESKIFLDNKSIPATLIPTHGQQGVVLERGLSSRVEFGLAPMVALTGVLLSPEAKPVETGAEPLRRPIGGARIELTSKVGQVVAESITASDGSYYFNVLPGNYEMWVDPQTVHPSLVFNEPAFAATVVGVEEFQELEFEPIYAEYLTPDDIKTRVIVASEANSAEEIIAEEKAYNEREVAAEVPEISGATEAAAQNPNVAADALPVEGSIDLSRPKVQIPDLQDSKQEEQFAGILNKISGTLLGEIEDRSGFAPLGGVRLLLLTDDGTQLDVVTTDNKGRYAFEVTAGSYAIALDPVSVPLQFIYEVPAMTVKIQRKESRQSVTLRPIQAYYLEIDN